MSVCKPATNEPVQQPIFVLPEVYRGFTAHRGRYNLLVGGAGSGKSMAAATLLLYRMLLEPGARFLVVRKVAATLRRSVFQLFADLITEHNLGPHMRLLRSELRIEASNGAQLLFSGLDNPEKIKSIQGITSVWVEEATELEDADFRQLELRVRGRTVGYQQFILTCNPTTPRSFVYERFCRPGLPPNPEVLLTTSTAFDNPFIDPAYLQTLLHSLRTDENLFRIYALGLWGTERKRDLFYKRFANNRHVVAEAAADPAQPLHLSFDFNVQPYLTCTVWQIEGLRAIQVDELCLHGPRNTVADMGAALLQKFGRTWPPGVYLYGDPSGMARTVATDKPPFAQLIGCLVDWDPQPRICKQAPPVALRGRWINHLLAEPDDGQPRLRIAANCRHTLEDYAQVQEAPDGTKAKPRRRDKGSPYSYEPYGHCSDANDYFLCQAFRPMFEAFGRITKARPGATAALHP